MNESSGYMGTEMNMNNMEFGGHDDNDGEENCINEESLPFVVDDCQAGITETLFGFKMNMFASPPPGDCVLSGYCNSRALLGGSSAHNMPPALASSVVSCPTDGESYASSASDPYSNTGSGSLRQNQQASYQLHSGEWEHNSHKQEILSSNIHAFHTATRRVATETVPTQPTSVLMPSTSEAASKSILSASGSSLASTTAATPSAVAPGSESIRFSQLMQVADNTNDILCQTNVLPTLQEEEDADSQISSLKPPTSSNDETSRPNWPHTDELLKGWMPISSFPLTSSLPAAGNDRGYDARSSLQLSMYNHQHQQHLGVSDRYTDPIEVIQIDDNSFQVSVDISLPCNVRNVMDVVADPELLQLWCDPIRSLIIINSSEGSRNNGSSSSPYDSSSNTMNREEADGILDNSQQDQLQQHSRAEYEGEWIEATSMDLVSPYGTGNAGSCFYSMSKAMWNCVGFPSYGNVTIFVERPKRRVGLTIGPFAGRVMTSHTITVVEMDEPSNSRSNISIKNNKTKIRIVNKVQLTQELESSLLSNIYLCGVTACMEKCFLPTIDGYIAQVSSSMRRLRVLVENREKGIQCYDDDNIRSFEMERSNNAGRTIIVGENSSSRTTPLLSENG